MKFKSILQIVYVSSIIFLLIYAAGMCNFIDHITLSNGLDNKYSNVTVWKFALKSEHWVFVHFMTPFLFAVFSGSLSTSICIIYGWESFEAALAIIISTVVIVSKSFTSYFSDWLTESIGDSLIGDPFMGIIGILFAMYLMTTYFPEVKRVLTKGHHTCDMCRDTYRVECIIKNHITFFLFLLNFVTGSWCEILAGVVFHYKLPNQQPQEYIICIGFLLYPFCRLLWFDILWYQLIPHIKNEDTLNEIGDFIYTITFIFISVYMSALFLTTLTYPVVFVGVGVTFFMLKLILSRRK